MPQTTTTFPTARVLLVASTLLLAASSSACNDSTGPAVTPGEQPDTATYDLVFEQDAFPLNASDIRIRRKGGTEHQPLFGQVRPMAQSSPV